MRRNLLFVICLMYTMLWCQESPTDKRTSLEDEIESLLLDQEAESDFDFNTLGEHLIPLLSQPLNLNQANLADLEALELLDDLQIRDILNHRDKLGPFVAIYELQSVRSLDAQTLSKVLPFITVNESPKITTRTLGAMHLRGDNQLFVRSDRLLEQALGYQADGPDPAAYRGSPERLYVRFRHRFEDRLSYGLTFEKDAGEKLFTKQAKGLPVDFASWHWYLHNPGKKLRSIAIGDYTVSLGQGLIMHNGFGRGKGALVSHIKRSGRWLRPYTAVNENLFLRGAAAEMNWNRIHALLFVSLLRKDANLISSTDPVKSFSSLPQSGYHRTSSEITDQDAVVETMMGASLRYVWKQGRIAFNHTYTAYDGRYEPRIRPYNQFQFRGTGLHNSSLDYTWQWNNFHFFGESALNPSGAAAFIHGLMIGIGKSLDLVLLHRWLAKDYQTLYGNAFTEATLPSNERGLYTGLNLRFNQRLKLSLYADYFHFPWLTFLADTPSNGQEYLVRLEYYKKRDLTAYLQFRVEHKEISVNTREATDPLFIRKRQYLRFHISKQLGTDLELRTRLELSSTLNAPAQTSAGMMLFQDILFRPRGKPWSVTGRIALFDIDDYAARIYAYENDLVYSFSIPAFFDEGWRYYLNLRYRLATSLSLEARWARTQYFDRTEIGSGLEVTQGNQRNQLKAQVIWKF